LQHIANHLDRAMSGVGRQPLWVLVQVNTSGEECRSQTLTLSSSFRTYKNFQSIDNFICGCGTHVFVTSAADLKIIWSFLVIWNTCASIWLNFQLDSEIRSGAIWMCTSCKACEARLLKLTFFWTYDHRHVWLCIHTWKFSGNFQFWDSGSEDLE
jgi:hypothetical protein